MQQPTPTFTKLTKSAASNVARDHRLRTAARQVLFLGLAAFFFSLAAAGVVLPGLPATPFLLLTSYFLVRSSPRLNLYLLQSRVFGPILRDWQQHRGVRYAVKMKAIVAVSAAIGATTYLSPLPILVKGLVIGLALVGIGVIVRLRTVAQ